MKKAVAGSTILALIIFMGAGITHSCSHDTIGLDQFDTVCFERDILPVFINGCATNRCHDAASHQEGFTLDSYEGIMQGITAGSLKKSKIYQLITDPGPLSMPPDNPISIDDRTRIRLWIEQGAMKTSCPPDSIYLTGDVK
jgi:hypothetical protein